MKLAKALKLKNKKLSDYRDALKKAIAYNSHDERATVHYDSKEELDKAFSLLNDYIAFKTAIHLSTNPIRALIFELGELKSLLSSLSSMSTQEGPYRSGYSSSAGEDTVKVCKINELEKEEMLNNIKTQIDEIQDEIDLFNATTDLSGYNE